jgi:hypothetical protein
MSSSGMCWSRNTDKMGELIMTWDYAELSKMAKKNGGPEKLVEILVKSGEKKVFPWAGVAFVVGIILTLGVQKTKRYFSQKKNISVADVELAKEELIQGIKDYDAAHTVNPNVASDNFRMDKLAYCGLYCEQCSYKRAHDDKNEKHLQSIPYTNDFKELSVYNCESCKGYCICGACNIKPCAIEKNISSCAECGEFPCEHILAFENDGIPHHKMAVSNLRCIKQFGINAWFQRLKPSLRCEQCGQRQSWYYICDEQFNK